MATVILPNGKRKTVKNLGWWVDRLWQTERVEVKPATEAGWDVTMTAYLKGGIRFRSHWADRTVCWSWLHRPSLYDTPLDWIGVEYTIKPGDGHRGAMKYQPPELP